LAQALLAQGARGARAARLRGSLAPATTTLAAPCVTSAAPAVSSLVAAAPAMSTVAGSCASTGSVGSVGIVCSDRVSYGSTGSGSRGASGTCPSAGSAGILSGVDGGSVAYRVVGTTQMPIPATISTGSTAGSFAEYAPTSTSMRETGASVSVSGAATEVVGSAVANTVQKDQVVAGSVSRYLVEIPTVQAVMQVQEIPGIQTVERVEGLVQKNQRPAAPAAAQTLEVPKIIPHERVRQRTVEQVVEVSVPHEVEETVEVAGILPQKRVQQRTVEQAVDMPVPQQRQVPSVQTIQKTVEVSSVAMASLEKAFPGCRDGPLVLLGRSYARVRETVRLHARPPNACRATFDAKLSRPTKADLLVLESVLKHRQKHSRKRKLWGNCKKELDSLGKQLPSLSFSSAKRVCPSSARELLKASFKMRALCVTSRRYKPDALPKQFVPHADQRYKLYGRRWWACLRSAASKKQRRKAQRACQAKHDEWTKAYGAFPVDLTPSRERKLTVQSLKRKLHLGHFVALQVLTDFAAQAPRSHYSLPENLGDGVRLVRGAVLRKEALEKVRAVWAADSQMRGFVGRLKTQEVGHLVCEIRQWTMADLTEKGRRELLEGLSAEPLSSAEDRQRWLDARQRLWDMSQ